jgi:hypothetical protein
MGISCRALFEDPTNDKQKNGGLPDGSGDTLVILKERSD